MRSLRRLWCWVVGHRRDPIDPNLERAGYRIVWQRCSRCGKPLEEPKS